MVTLTLLCHKGGSGKSTLALGLGVECATTRGATCIIDIDPQGTSVTWSDQRGQQNDPVVTATQPNRLALPCTHIIRSGQLQHAPAVQCGSRWLRWTFVRNRAT